ncbi:Glycine/D-amino acid oxidase [Methylobacterium sp. UNC378MF]|jgi:hydrogen cyanide synthase HcnC|uniref:NAD(P)/FAD-dependent oxidoreductase n=1 Tax=Methylobacterium sp. UNC378MF TaxID=1502748 RepID=UPI0008860DAA|nr:FAD-dependent oxidoreductase [Methylobacterium sp. UNC378MF]SDA10124.1 Glycine/D-amino acid oxidase [Methylobacterium sp. UNC378MF]
MNAIGHATRDAIVIGGGLVGAAIAYGLQRQGLSTVMLDEGDVAHRASRGNFGLVWVQSKGLGAPHYQHWTHASARAWPELAADLLEATGIGVGLHQPGGLHFCFSDDEMAQRDALMGQLRREAGNAGYEYRMITAAELHDMVPGLGPQVVGASWTPYDGHASPLHLLRALHAAFQGAGGLYRPNALVTAIKALPGDFAVDLGADTVRAPRLVLASGLGNADLAPLVGLSAPLRPERGQILVTERARQVLALPTHVVRQTEEGSLLLGDSKEDLGFDTLTQTPAIMRAIARRAVQTFPWIAELNIVRAWAALRVMSPDGKPIYDASERFPGAYIANCHSGVTLAGAHASLLAPMIAAGALAPDLSPFSARRFHVQKTA